MDIYIEPALESDAEALRKAQDRAFYEDYRTYGICPGYGRTAADLVMAMRRSATYKILVNREVVGKVSVKPLGEGRYHVGCLCVVPEYQDNGIGRQALAFVEGRFPDAREWTLETPANDARNCAFYARCGYSTAGNVMDEDGVPLITFRKEVQPRLIIRPDRDAHLRELKAWLSETWDVPAEEMSAFFSARVDTYEAHMELWTRAYLRVAEFLPETARTLLDLGCGTGLQLDAILARRPEMQVTGVDLCEDMLKALRKKHPQVKTLCGDFFTVPLGENRFDAAVSVEALHHFAPEHKLTLYRRLCAAIKPGGTFLVCDYLACCPEEEVLLAAEGARRRREAKLPEDAFIHFDTPLTLERETELLRAAGFCEVLPVESIEGATIVKCIK